MKRTTNFPPEVRERAVHMVREHQGEHESQWAAICSVATKMGCTVERLMRRLGLLGVRRGKPVKSAPISAA